MKFFRSVYDVFGYSPFEDLKKHEKLCVEAVKLMIEFFESRDPKIIDKVKEIEREADKLKDTIMKNVSDVMIPVDKYKLLNLITLQDNIINTCEDLVTLLYIKNVAVLKQLLQILSKIIQEYDELFRALEVLLAKAFAKSEVENVHNVVKKITELKEMFEREQANFVKSLASCSTERFIFLKEVESYLYRIVENIHNSAKMFEYMLG
jgi:predicted phosphate transport protein (TIGR00153 family)